MLRLNKYLAHAGVGSRRHCDDLLVAGRVKVNGEIIRDLGMRVDPAKVTVHVDDHVVKAEKHVYWAINKPRGYLCTNHDPAGRPLATDLIPHVDQRVYTVGRLDEDSEGLLLMTNDGDLAQQLMHPRFGVEKTYEVLVAGSPSPDDLKQLTTGVWLAEGRVKAKYVKKFKRQGESTWLKIVLAEGKNREVRRMLAKLKHKVMRLKRVGIGPIKLDRLPKGKSRKLALPEIEALRRIVVKQAKPAVEQSAS
jgi:23S rRNA pseudouridine2605 synthase